LRWCRRLRSPCAVPAPVPGGGAKAASSGRWLVACRRRRARRESATAAAPAGSLIKQPLPRSTSAPAYTPAS
jgi:hypothetical protein